MDYSFAGLPFFNGCILSSKNLFILLVSSTVIKWHLRFLKVNIHLIWICWGWPKTRGSLWWKAECCLCVSQRELFLPESSAESTPITIYTAFRKDDVTISTKCFVLWYTKKLRQQIEGFTKESRFQCKWRMSDLFPEHFHFRKKTVRVKNMHYDQSINTLFPLTWM